MNISFLYINFGPVKNIQTNAMLVIMISMQIFLVISIAQYKVMNVFFLKVISFQEEDNIYRVESWRLIILLKIKVEEKPSRWRVIIIPVSSRVVRDRDWSWLTRVPQSISFRTSPNPDSGTNLTKIPALT